jgi:hypothetical protein
MLGYNMQYYRSATTDVNISYKKSNSTAINNYVIIDKFTNIKDTDNSINYVTLKQAEITKDNYSVTVPCIEGELISCETDNNNIITTLHLDDNNRYYFRERLVAENGVFVTNISNGLASEE